jgi:hypothetical protein
LNLAEGVTLLRSFRVANHKSFRDEQELVLLPAYTEKKKRNAAVPVVGIFGSNAAGKSNLIDAVSFLASAVRDSYSRWEPYSGVPRTPFRLDPALAAEPSVYVVDLLLDGVRHVYGMAVDDEQFVEEWLYAYPKGKKRIILERTDDVVRLGPTLDDYRRRSRFLSEQTRNNASALGTAAVANQPEVEPIYEWFRSSVAIRRPARRGLMPRAESFSPGNPDRQALVELVRAADLGIDDVQLVEVPVEDPGVRARIAAVRDRVAALRRRYADAPEDLQLQIQREIEQLERYGRSEPGVRNELVFLHGKVPLSSQEQSDGTMAWLSLLSSAMSVLRRGTLLCVDEIDSSLHSRLTARLIKLFEDTDTNPRGAQLIFTTHDASLLGSALGGPVLERDEIWFVEKGPDGATGLYPLTDFHPRTGENTERRYLGGSYGAVPVTVDEDFRRALEGNAEADS